MTLRDIEPAILATYVRRSNCQRMILVRLWRNQRGIHTAELRDAMGREWIGPVEDFWQVFVHRDIARRWKRRRIA